MRPTIVGLVLGLAALGVAVPAQADPFVLCLEETNSVLHVAVTVDASHPCPQECPSMVNVNVAVSIWGDIEQCNSSERLLKAEASVPLCRAAQGPWTDDCQEMGTAVAETAGSVADATPVP